MVQYLLAIECGLNIPKRKKGKNEEEEEEEEVDGVTN